MSALTLYRAHVEAAAAGDDEELRRIWVPDGVVEFPYAQSLGTASRLEGIGAIVDYFTGLRLFGPFTFGPVDLHQLGADQWLAELHADSTLLASGTPYAQDYIVRFSTDGARLTWMREYWDPTRAVADGVA